MSELQIFGDCLCSSLPVPTQWFLQASICILHWQWVFPAILLGTRLYSPHKSKDTIKATHQRAIKGTTHIAMERMLLNRQFLQTFSPRCCSKCRRDCSWCLPLQPPESGSSQNIRFCAQNVLSSSGAWSTDSGASLSSPLWLVYRVTSFLEDPGHWLLCSYQIPFLRQTRCLAFLQWVQILMSCCLLSNRKRIQTLWFIIHLNDFMERLGNDDSMKLLQVKWPEPYYVFMWALTTFANLSLSSIKNIKTCIL